MSPARVFWVGVYLLFIWGGAAYLWRTGDPIAMLIAALLFFVGLGASNNLMNYGFAAVNEEEK